MSRKQLGVHYLRLERSFFERPRPRLEAVVRMFAGIQFALFLLTTLWGCGLTSGAGYRGGPPPSTFEITTPSLPAAPVSQPYSVTLAAAGGKIPFTWSVVSGSGSLPPGLTLNAATGAISGTPSAASAYVFKVQVTDSSSTPQTATMPATIITVPFDQYGGRTDIKCATVTPYFHLEKLNNRWYFCDPAGNGFISMNVGNFTINVGKDCNKASNASIFAAKYSVPGDAAGTGSNYQWQSLKRLTSWGFNSVGQDAGMGMPWQTCGGAGCVWPGGTQPIKVPYIIELKPTTAAAQNLFGYLTGPIKDMLNGTNGNYYTYRGGASLDVFDPKLPTEITDEITLSGQPISKNIRNNDPYLLGIFTDDSDWFSSAGASPDFGTAKVTANVGFITLITSPVHTFELLPTYASTKTLLYQDTTVYSKAQATSPSTACSIQNPCSLRDYLWQKYSTALQGPLPPCVHTGDTGITALNDCWGSNYTTFDSSGTQVAGESIGTGDGVTTVFTHTLAHTPVSPFSVLISVGGAAQIGDCPWFIATEYFKCPSESSNVGSLGSPTSNYIAQSSNTINYSTGVVTIKFVSPPASGTAITVSYIYGGWMAGGTGLMDESGGTGSQAGCPGSGSACWAGTNLWCLEGANPSYPNYFACTGAGGSSRIAPNANPNLGADLDSWVSEWAAKYFKTMHDSIKSVSKVPYLGLDILGGWAAPAYSKFLQGAAPYLDGAFVQIFYSSYPVQSSPAEFQSMYQYLTQYLGDVPLLDFANLYAEADSSYSCNTVDGENFPTQAARGQEYYNTVNYLLTNPGFNGTYPFVGFDWWAWMDFQGFNQGLVSIHDNAYDGVESVSGTVLCNSSYAVGAGASCGNEAASYGDVISQVRIANLLWLH